MASGFMKKPAPRQTGKIKEDRGRSGGPTHKVGNKSMVGGPPPGASKTMHGTRKNSLQGSDSPIAGARRGMKPGKDSPVIDAPGYHWRQSTTNKGLFKGGKATMVSDLADNMQPQKGRIVEKNNRGTRPGGPETSRKRGKRPVGPH